MPDLANAVVYVNANVLTLDRDLARGGAVRIHDGRVADVWVGQPGPDVAGRRIDLGGATVLPGLVDAHFHLRGLGEAARTLNLVGTRSRAEVQARVAEAVAKAAPGAWIRGRGWDQNDWSERGFPTAADLEAVAPSHPVWLTRVDGHAVWLNRTAMKLVGIDATTPDPPGGELLRDRTKRPTGILIDNAIDAAEAKLPRASPAELEADLLAGLERCRRVGLTGVHDMATSSEELTALRRLEAEGRLTLRVTAYLAGNAADLPTLLSAPPTRGPRLSVVGVKLFADGALGSRGAALLAPYLDRPDNAGLLLLTPEQLAAKAVETHRAGYQLAIHAIGDRGNRVSLDAIERAQGGDNARRHRIEHAQVVDGADFERFRSLGVVASMQPTHATSDMPWAEARLGADRLAGAYAWRRMLVGGIGLALGSDAPVEDENPWLGIYAAVTRQDPSGQPAGGWRADQRLAVLEALEGFTRGPALAIHEASLGSLRPGALADLTIVDRDPTAIPAADLKAVRTLRTVVAGREVYSAER